MPNWCYNTINIEGPREELDKFVEKAKSKDKDVAPSDRSLSFQNFLPSPTGEWEYNWCVENWGTKWDARYPNLEDGGGSDIMYSFDTAWSPPTPVVTKMIYDFPKLRFSLYYEEPGCNFQGELEGYNGEIEKDECIEYHPECMECGFRDYPVDLCEYDTDEIGFLCPKCYIETYESKDWDDDRN